MFLKGYLTYSLSALFVVAGLWSLLNGGDAGIAWELIGIGGLAFGLRRAIR